jgi:hypothetical protein
VSEIVKADNDAGARGQLVRATAVVTYSDPDWRVMFVQDQGSALYIALPPGSTAESGDRVQIAGNISSLANGLDNVSVSVLSKNNALPPPFRVTDYSDLSGSLSAFVAVEGTVRWTGVRDGGTAIQLVSGDKPVLVYVRRALIADLPPLGSKVGIAGVAAADIDSNGQFRGAKLFSPSPDYVKILDRGPTDPFSLPVKTLAGLKETSEGALVHVRGEIQKGGQGLTITHGKLSMPLSIRESFQGTAADVAGFWTGRSLDDALARPLRETVSRPLNLRPVLDGDIVHLILHKEEAPVRIKISDDCPYADPLACRHRRIERRPRVDRKRQDAGTQTGREWCDSVDDR